MKSKRKSIIAAVAMACALCAAQFAAFATESGEGFLDLTVGDRVAAAEEPLVVDPAWGEASEAQVQIDGEANARTYSSASIDTWLTASLEPGRYALELTAGTDAEAAAFWKTGDDWVIFDSSNITADVTFEAGKTYLFFGTNTADGATLKVEDGAKFFYDEGAPAGFLGGTVNPPKRYKQETVEGDLYQIVELIKGCEDNPWIVGEGVEAYTNGAELVIGGNGTIADISGIPAEVMGGVTALTIAEPTVTGAEAQAFAGLGDPTPVALTLPDGWQGELPGEGGNWYGAKVELTAYPLTVKNVTFLQRYPWNGKVDVGFTLTGPAGETNVVVTVCTNGTKIADFTAAVTIPADGVLATNLVWDAETAGLAANFKSDNVTVEVALEGEAVPQPGQLWKYGPIWAEYNVGATKPGDDGELYMFNDNKAVNAAKSFGDGWRLPTKAELDALGSNCTKNWETCKNSTDADREGYRFTGKMTGYTDKSIFLPAAGFSDGGGQKSVGSKGLYWSSSEGGRDNETWGLFFSNGSATVGSYVSGFGMSVRAVRDAPPPSASDIAAVSAEGFLDLTVGDRIAADEEPIVVDPAWGEASEAQVQIDGEGSVRTYSSAGVDTWNTASLEPGRYAMALTAGTDAESAAFWKTGDDWVIFDSSNITADVTFEAGKTYLFFGTNTADGVTLKVEDGAKFEYDERAPAGFLGGTVNLPTRYEQKTVEGEFYQIVEKIMGCEDNPWIVGEGVEAYTNGTELVIGGNGTIADISGIPAEVMGGVTALTIAEPTVTGAEAQAFAGLGDPTPVALTLPDGWQGELPGEGGNWYGAKVELTAYPLTVRNVTFRQRYPWNGKVDVGFTLTGPNDETNVVVTVRDGANKVANFTAAVVIDENGVLETNLVWDASAAGLAANFKSDDVTVEVAFAGGLPAGQLWKDGPIWAECNVGDGATVPGDYGALYTFEGDKAKAAAEGLGDGWRLPSYDELEKLDECTKSWETSKDGTGADRWGYRFTGTGDYSSNSIFLPAAGYSSDGGRESAGSYGYYWSSEVANDGDAWHLYFWNGQVCMNASYSSCGMPVRAVRNAPAASPASAISAKSAAGTVDLRTNVALAEGETTVSNVTWSATLWGELDEEFVTAIGWTNLTTGATGVFSNLAGVVGDATEDADLPQKDGDYRLTHSTGDLTSFVKFTVSGYPLGSEGNPWEIGANAAADVIAFSNGTGTVFFNPARTAVTKAGLETVTSAMGGASFPAKLISEDGSETNDLVMVLGASGAVYDTLADALAADEASYTLFEAGGYFVSYDANGAAGTMADDTFVPTVPTNLTANAYAAVGYEFAGWTTNGSDEVAFADRAEGVDFAQPGETLVLRAKWTETGVDIATFDALTNALVAATNQAASLPVTVNLTDDITVPQGGVVKVYARPAVTFAGTGTFDVTAERPALFCGYPVGTGLKPEDLDRFVTDKDVKTYFEDGKVVVRGRGETEEFPWLIGTEGHEDEVTAWAGNEMILAKPARGTASVAALQSVTNALSGYVPGSGELKVISADGTATNDVVMLLGSDGVVYDTLAEVLAADPQPETVRLFEVTGYFVSYSGGEGAAGAMADDTFIPTVPTNLTANAFEMVGYGFAGWSTDGATKAYDDCATGVDFAQPGETLALTALWTQVETKAASYDELTNLIAKATRPVTITLDEDIELPADGTIVVPDGKSVTFTGDGKFDVTATIPTLFNGITVGTGLKPEDLDRFETDADVKAYYEDGKVVVCGRGETEDFPWLLGTDGHEDEVTAWAGGEMTLVKPARGTASVAALQSVTNALRGSVPGPGVLKVISADGTATNDVVMLLGSDGVAYDTLAEVLAADPQPETVRLFEVGGYTVSYSGGEGAAGAMADDLFIPTVPTNLTANAFEIIGYGFAGWSTDGATKAYDDCATGVDFAQPGETLALTALWTQVETKPASYDELTNLIAKATRPVTITLDEDIELPADGTIVVPEGKSVTFTGDGKFDVTATIPTLFNEITVGTGLKPEDLDRFETDADVKAYYEDGKVVVRRRGETEEFPWLLGDGVTAWAGGEMVLAKPVRGTASVAALQSVTNALSGYVPGSGELKVISADGTATNDVVMLLGSDGVAYDTLAEVLAADPQPETVRLFEVGGYTVSYSGGEGAAGAMADDLFIPTVPTNLTANAFEIIGYGFAGWSTDGATKAYDDCATGVDFAQPGETLALTALWTQVETVPANYDELTNLIAKATRPVTFTLDENVEIPAGSKIVVPAGKDVTFTGEGKFDVSGIVPQFGEPVVVAEGVSEDDLEHFDADGVSKLVFEDGKVVLVARGESEDFPWVLDEEKGVTAWADGALTDFAAVVIDDGMPAATNGIDLVALTNNIAAYGYEPEVTPLNAFLKVTDGDRTTYLTPVGWIGENDVYATLEDALAAGETVVVPDFSTEEVSAMIAETVTGDDGTTCAAVIENETNGNERPLKASRADGLLELAANERKNVTLVVESVEEACVLTEDAEAFAAVNTNGLADVIGYVADYVDLSLWSGDEPLDEIDEPLAIHMPMTVNPRKAYRVARIHGGAMRPFPVGAENAVDGEYAEFLADGVVIHAKKYSLYSIGEITLLPRYGIVVGNGSKLLGEPDPASIATNFTVNVQGLDIEPEDIRGYCVRAKGEAAGDYAINFVCTSMPQDFDGELVVFEGTFTIVMDGKRSAAGKVKYPSTAKAKGVDTGLVREKAKATWTAVADSGSTFAGWVAAEGAPECVANHLAAFSENEQKNRTLSFKVGAGERIAPSDVAATWVRIDEDLIESVTIDEKGLRVATRSHVTASVSGLPCGLKFNSKTLAISGTVKAKDKTYAVKVTVKNASGYTWRQTFGFTVAGNAVTAVVPADDLVATGVPVLLRCDPAMGKVTGTGVYALGKDGTKKVSIGATALNGYVFAGWYEDPGFSTPATFMTGTGRSAAPKDYRNASQKVTVTGPTYLFARFVAKTTKADPITWLRYEGAGYCGADAGELAEEETWYQGVALPTNACAIAFGSASLPTVTVKGLPAGVKFDKVAQRFTGVPTAASTAKKPVFTVKVSVKNKSGATDVLVKKVRVEPLPAWAVGNFDGYHQEDGTTNGTFTATVGKTGKVSGKTAGGLASTTFSANSFANVELVGGALCYVADVTVSYRDPTTKKTVKAVDTLYLMEDPETGLGMIGGGDENGSGAVGVQRAWDRKDLALPDFDTKALKAPLALGNGVTLKFGAKGKVTVGGKVAGDDGSSVSVSGSTYVLPLAWRSTMTPNLLAQVYVYVAPKKNLVGGASEVYGFLLSVGDGGKFDKASVVPPADIHVQPIGPALLIGD